MASYKIESYKNQKWLFKGSMHHTHDVSLKDAFCIIHMAAKFYFLKFFTIS